MKVSTFNRNNLVGLNWDPPQPKLTFMVGEATTEQLNDFSLEKPSKKKGNSLIFPPPPPLVRFGQFPTIFLQCATRRYIFFKSQHPVYILQISTPFSPKMESEIFYDIFERLQLRNAIKINYEGVYPVFSQKMCTPKAPRKLNIGTNNRTSKMILGKTFVPLEEYIPPWPQLSLC